MKLSEKIIEKALALCAWLTILTTIGIILVLLVESIAFFREVSIIDFFTQTQWTLLFANKKYGIWPLLTGTFLHSFIVLAVDLPTGLTIAIYLSEYAGKRLRKIIKPLLEILAVVPRWCMVFLR